MKIIKLKSAKEVLDYHFNDDVPNKDYIVNAMEEYAEQFKPKCKHPFERLHWVENVVYCNKCGKTLHK